MRLEQLEYLLAVAHTQSMNLASEQFHISQPAISHALKELEKELGAPLLYKTNKGSYLMSQGQIVADYARQTFALLDDMRQSLAGQRPQMASTPLWAAFSHSAEQLYLSYLLPYWYQHHPEKPLEVETMDVASAIGQAARGEVSAACVTLDKSGQKQLPEEVLFYPVQTFFPYTICNTQSALAQKSSVTISELASYRLTTKISPDACENYGYKLLAKHHLLDHLIASSAADPAFIKEMVSQNIAVGVFFHIQDLSVDKIKFDEYEIPLPIRAKERFQFGYVVQKQQGREPITQLIAALQHVCQLRCASYIV